MTDLAQLGIQIDSRTAVAAVSDLDQLSAAAGRAEMATQDLSAANRNLAPAMGTVTRGAGSFANSARMMSQQLSQVGQQTMATGNFMQALAIQLPDIGLAFGAVGAAVGLVAAVGLPLLIQAMGSAGEQATTLEDRLDELKQVSDGLKAAQDIMKMSVVELYTEYGIYAGVVRQAAAALAELQVAQAQDALADSILASADALDQYTGAAATAFSSGVRMADGLANIKTEFGLGVQEAQRMQRALIDIRTATTFEEQIAALSRLRQLMQETGLSAAQLPDELRQALIEANQASIAMAQLRNQAENAADAAAAIAANAPGAGFLSGAIESAATLAATLWDAAAGAAAAGGSELGDDSGLPARARSRPRSAPQNVDYGVASGRAGGGGATDDFEARLEALRTELATEAEVVNAWYVEQQAVLADRRAVEILGEQAHKEAMLALEGEYQSRLAEIQGSGTQQRLNDMSSFWGSLGGVIAAGGGQATKAYAAVMGAQAVISAYAGAAKALADPNISWWGRLAAYASVLSAGLGAAAAIKSAGSSGASSAASVGASIRSVGSTPAAQATSVQEKPVQQIEYIVRGIDDDTMLSGKMLKKVFDGILSEADLRGVKMVFA